MRAATTVLTLLVLASCHDPNTVTLEDYNTRDIAMPGGEVVHAEVASTQPQVEKGLMFRTSLAPGRGMLFVFSHEAVQPFWMYQTLIPLDIIWMDANRKIQAMAKDAQPCKTEASQCPTFGGQQPSLFVLEVPAGSIAKYHLKLGDVLRF